MSSGAKQSDGGSGSSSAAAQVSPSIVVIIIVLTIIFFLSAFLHLLIRWLARNQRYARNRRGRGRGADGGGDRNRVVTLTAIQGQLQQLFTLQDSGLERASIDELPVFAYKAIMSGLKEGADCAICLSEFQCDDELRLLPSCAHAFHTSCIDTWLSSRSTCPLCRVSLLPAPLPARGCALNPNPNSYPNPNPAPYAYPDSNPNPYTYDSDSNLDRVGPHPNPSLPPSPFPDLLLSELGFPFDSSSILSNHTDQIHTPLLVQPTSTSSSSSSSTILPAVPSENTCRSSLSSHTLIPSLSPPLLSSSSSSLPPLPHSTAMCTATATNGTAAATTLPSIPREPTCSSSTSSHLACLQPTPTPHNNPAFDSGRISYTSLGNQSFAASEASSYGSGRRISVQLGKCRFNKPSTTPTLPFFNKSKGKSKGSVEYVFDSSSNIEVFVPDLAANANASVSTKPPSRLNDLLNTSLRTNASSESIRALGPQQALPSAGLNLCWLDTIGYHTNDPELDWCPYSKNGSSSLSSSMRANLGSDPRSSTLGVSGSWSNQRMDSGNAGIDRDHSDRSKRAVSFRLPENASATNARLKASASRRSLSESEAFTFWEPSNEKTTTPADSASCEMDNDEQRLVSINDASGQRSSSFAKRTMEWLVGWQKRMVHPDGSMGGNDCKA